MNWILILLATWSRPALTPISASELGLVAQREAELMQVRTGETASPWQPDVTDRIPGRFVVGFRTGAFADVQAWAFAEGGEVVWRDDRGCFAAVQFPAGLCRTDAELSFSAGQVPGIRYFEPDLRVKATVIPNDPYFLQSQWDKWVMYADQAWDLAGAAQVRVAVIDNGIEYVHPDLAANFHPGELGYDFIGNDDDPKPDNPAISEAFHGTHVAGIIAATRDNNVGVAGWAAVQLLAVRVLDDSGSGNTSVLASGIRWAADHGCRIANMSLGAQSASTSVTEACQYAAGLDVLLVAASGNEGRGLINHPAALDQCIAVGATNEDSRLSAYSNYGQQQELVAPGTDVLSPVPGGYYEQASGTSMAAPQVSGVAALVLSTDTSISATRLRAVLDAAAVDMGSVGRDQTYGFGLLNSRRAVDLALVLRQTACLAAASLPVARSTIVRGALSVPAWASHLAVHDASGRLVVSVRNAGDRRLALAPGAYFVRLEGRGRVRTEKALLLR